MFRSQVSVTKHVHFRKETTGNEEEYNGPRHSLDIIDISSRPLHLQHTPFITVTAHTFPHPKKAVKGELLHLVLKEKKISCISLSCINTTIWMHQMNADKTHKEKFNWNYTRMLRTVLNKSLKQHLKNQKLYGHLTPIEQTIQVRRARYAGHYWRRKDNS